MLILGLLLIAAALVVFGYMFFGTSDLPSLDIDLGVFTVQLTPLHLYLLGAATLVVLALGLLALAAGMKAARRRRQEVKELRKAVRDGGTDYDQRGGRREERTPPVTDRRDVTDWNADREVSTRDDFGRSDSTDARVGESAGGIDPTPYEREVPSGYPAAQPSTDGQADGNPDIRIPSDYDGPTDRDSRRGPA